MKTRVVITGIGVISALGDSPAALHSALCNGQAGAYRLPETCGATADNFRGGSIACFQAGSYLKGKHLRPLDRTGQMVAAAAKLALENSKWTSEQLGTHDVGLVLGTMFGSLHTISQFDRQGIVQGPVFASPMDFANTVINAATGQSAIWHNLRGINSTIAGGSASGLMALGYAADLIRFSGQTAVLAGGCEEFCFEAFCGFDRAGMLCRPTGQNMLPVPFAAGRTGFAVAEAAGLLMLEEWESALARGATVLGEIRGHGIAHDPDGGLPEHGAAAIVRAMRVAMADAGLSPEGVDCISASANGSVAADRNEALAIHSVFNGRGSEIPVTAIKSMTGETLGATGALQLIDLVETVRTSVLPPIRGLEQSDPALPALNFCRKRQDIRVRSGLVSSVGIDGNVCALLLAEPPAPSLGQH
jgi:3-oxoacyl-[acyl-carrier-protein] synthase II